MSNDTRPIHPVTALAMATIERELAAFDASSLAPGIRAPASDGQSAVFSLRMDPDELRALRRRADLLQLPPTVLARNLIRAGLTSPRADRAGLLDIAATTALTELQSAAGRLREALAAEQG